MTCNAADEEDYLVILFQKQFELPSFCSDLFSDLFMTLLNFPHDSYSENMVSICHNGDDKCTQSLL